MAVFTAPRPVFAKSGHKTHHKPRNPLLAHSLFRKAGLHGQSTQAQRQQGARALQAELKRLTSVVDDPGP